MPINVVCPGCRKRFTVSEKFAGQQGPCPNCRTVIQVPALEDQVFVHAPEPTGPKNSRGEAVIRPILREETRFSVKLAVGIGASVIVVMLLALLLRVVDEGSRRLVGLLGTLLLAPPIVLGGYTFLRNSELEPYRGKELYIRVAACAAVYAVLWCVYAWIAWVWEVPSFEIWQLFAIGVPAVLAGAFAAYASLDLDYSVGLIHYGLYLIATVCLSFLAGIKLNQFE